MTVCTGWTRAAVLAVVVLAAGASRAEEPPRADLVVAVGWLPETLDPVRGGTAIGDTILGALFEGLTRCDARTGQAVPGQAESWQVEEDGRRYVFRLRADARWTNGDPVTAHDFVRGWLHVLSPKAGVDLSPLLHVVKHARAYQQNEAALASLKGPAPEGGSPLLDELGGMRKAHPQGVTARTDGWPLLVERLRSNEVASALRDPNVLALLRRASDGLNASDLEELTQGLKGERARLEIESAEASGHFGKDQGLFARDGRTLVVELTGHTPWFLGSAARPFLAPRHASAHADLDLPGTGARAIVSNGPFLASGWSSRKHLSLRRNPAYWGAADVRSKTVEIFAEEDQAVRVARFRDGRVDWAPHLVEIDALLRGGRFDKPYAEVQTATYFLRLNCRRRPFTDARVRRALSLAIDRSALARKVLVDPVDFVTHVVPAGFPGYLAPESLLDGDATEARRLLAEAGFPGGKEIPALEYLTNVNPGHRRIAEHLAERWAAVLGIRVVPRFVEWQEFVQKMTAGDYDVARAGWVLDYFDPQAALDMWTSWSTQNHTGWSDARFDLFLELAGDVFAFGDASRPEQQEVLRVVRDEDHVRTALERLRTAKPAERLAAATHLRLALLREAEAVMVQEGFPVIPLYQYVTHGAIGQVEGFHTMLTGPDGDRRPNVEGLHPLRDLFVRR